MVTVVDKDEQDITAEHLIETDRVRQAARLSGDFHKLPEFDNIPELIRDVEREGRTTKTNIKIIEAPRSPGEVPGQRISRAEKYSTAPKADELEALWPGVHQDMSNTTKRTPSFYMMVGFMGGAAVSLVFVWCYAFLSPMLTAGNNNANIVIASNNPQGASTAEQEQPLIRNNDPNAALVPISSTYEVKSGDTLVVIAMKNYKKVTPRLLDEIVKVNNLKNANVLNLGQRLKLPEYVPQTSKIAATKTATVN